MANYILKNDKTILRCSNWAMEVLYNNLSEIIKNKFQQNSKWYEFLEHLNQDMYGRGCINVDIANFFNGEGKLQIQELYDLMGVVIQKIKDKKEFEDSFITLLEDFKAKIL